MLLFKSQKLAGTEKPGAFTRASKFRSPRTQIKNTFYMWECLHYKARIYKGKRIIISEILRRWFYTCKYIPRFRWGKQVTFKNVLSIYAWHSAADSLEQIHTWASPALPSSSSYLLLSPITLPASLLLTYKSITSLLFPSVILILLFRI